MVQELTFPQIEKPDTVRVVGLFPGLNKDSVEFQLFEELTNDFRSSYPSSHSFDATTASKVFKVCLNFIALLITIKCKFC